MNLINYLLVFFLIFASCKRDVDQSIISSQSGTSEKTEKRILDPVKESNFIAKMDSLDFMNALVQYINEIHCQSVYNVFDGCIGLHEVSIRTNFNSKKPINTLFPYKSQFSWDVLKNHKEFDEYWSDKCGYILDNNQVINYYCPNIKGEMGAWLTELSIENQLVADFMNMYRETETIDQRLQNSFRLQVVNALDFNNEDHQAFYWMYHLAFSELYFANIKISTLNNSK